MGISAPIARLYALGLGAAIAGLGGALLTFQQQPYPNFEFPALDSITAMQNTVIGGIGSLAGAPIGATFQPGTLSQHFFSFAGSDVVTITSVLAAVGVLLILTLAPEGLAMILGRYVPSPYRRWGRPRIPGAAPSAPWSHTGRWPQEAGGTDDVGSKRPHGALRRSRSRLGLLNGRPAG